MGKLLKDETYKSAMNQKNALLEVLVSDKLDVMSSDWAAVAQLVRSGYAPYIYQAGDLFSDTWTDTAASNKEYTYPWHIADIQNITLENSVTTSGMILQAHYAHPFGVQFSHRRAFLKCPNGLDAGTYYFIVEDKVGSFLAGDVVCFTLQSSVQENGRIFGDFTSSIKTNWRIYVYDADGKNQIGDEIIPTFEVEGINLGTLKLDVRNGNLNCLQEIVYGWNRWKTSALRQYLNSDKPKGEWWTPQDEWDIAPDQLASKDGFLCGMPQELLDVIKPVKITTYTYTTQNENEIDITYDKVFIPSLELMYIENEKSGEGKYWEYWKLASSDGSLFKKNVDNPQLIVYNVENHNAASLVRTRSEISNTSTYRTFTIRTSGMIGNYGGEAYATAKVTPCCVIC